MEFFVLSGLAAVCWLGSHELCAQNASAEKTSGDTERDAPLVTKVFPTRDTTLAAIRHAKNPQRELEASGVTFPPGSFARWTSQRKRLLVRDTVENVELLDLILARPKPKVPDPPPEFIGDQAAARAQLAGSYSYHFGEIQGYMELFPSGAYRHRSLGHMANREEVREGEWRLRNGWIVLKAQSGDKEYLHRLFIVAKGGGWALAPDYFVEWGFQPLSYYSFSRDPSPIPASDR